MADPFEFALNPPASAQSGASEFGRPPDNDPFETALDPLNRRIVPNILESGGDKPWEDVRGQLKAAGVADPEQFHGYHKVEEARTKLAKARESEAGQDISFGETYARNYAPLFSAVRGYREVSQYNAAMKRLQAGNATDEDYTTIAHKEELNKWDENIQKTLGGSLAHGLGRGAAILGESVLAGGPISRAIPGLAPAAGASLGTQAGLYAARQAVATPFMPSLYAREWAEKNTAAGRAPSDPRGLGTAGLMAFTNNLVLGTMQSGFGEGSMNLMQRLVAKGAIGVGEQQLADWALSGLDQLLGKDITGGVGNEYGLSGKIARGLRGKDGQTDWNQLGDAGKDYLVQALTFSLFAGMHEVTEGGKKIDMEKASKTLRDLSETLEETKAAVAKAGGSPAAAATEATGSMADVMKTVRDAMTKDEGLSRADLPALFPDATPATLKIVQQVGKALEIPMERAKPPEPDNVSGISPEIPSGSPVAAEKPQNRLWRASPRSRPVGRRSRQSPRLGQFLGTNCRFRVFQPPHLLRSGDQVFKMNT